jgi:cell division initiation protein
MDVSPKTLREVEFREKMRGYHPEDVDQFLEQVAAGLEVLQDRLRQAVERAQRAEQAAAEAGGSDETLRRTLVLAQRTADLAVQEAREQAARILAGAEQQAQVMLAEADERARRVHEESLADVRTELAKLEATRQQAQQEADALNRWVEEHRAHLINTLQDALAVVERAGLLSPSPVSRPGDLPLAARAPTPAPGKPAAAGAPPGPGTAPPGPATTGPGAAAAAASGVAPPPPPRPSAAIRESATDAGPETASWQPDTDLGGANGEAPPPPSARGAVDAPIEMSEDPPSAEEVALDEFFEDSDFGDDRRFGGRLRRRR